MEVESTFSTDIHFATPDVRASFHCSQKSGQSTIWEIGMTVINVSFSIAVVLNICSGAAHLSDKNIAHTSI